MRRSMVVRSFAIFVLVHMPMASESAEDAKTRELLRASGLEEQINRIPNHVLAGLSEERVNLPGKVYDILHDAVIYAYDAEQITNSICTKVSANMDRGQIAGVMKWLQSNLGQKITKLEEAASTPEGLQEMQVFAGQLQDGNYLQHRFNLMDQLDNATGATRMTVDIVLLTAYGVATALDTLLSEELKSGPAQLREQLEMQRQGIIEAHQQMTKIGFLYTYRTLTDTEIERYVKFAESELGRQYHTVVGSAVMAALFEATERMMDFLMSDFDQMPAKKRV